MTINKDTNILIVGLGLMGGSYASALSKQGYKAAFSASELKSAMEKGIINHQVIALGGIDSSNMHQLAKMGFGGAAVLGTIWNHTDLLSLIEELDYLSMKYKI